MDLETARRNLKLMPRDEALALLEPMRRRRRESVERRAEKHRVAVEDEKEKALASLRKLSPDALRALLETMGDA